MAKKKVEIAEDLIASNEIVEITDIPIATEIEPIEESVEEEPKAELPKIDAEKLLLEYIDKQEGEEVELNGFLTKMYEKEDSYMSAKLTKQLLSKLSIEGKINMSDVNWNDLDMHYYEQDGKSKKYLISDIKILAKK